MCFSWRGNSSFKDISAFLLNDNPLFLDNFTFLNRQNGIRVTLKTTSIEKACPFAKKTSRKGDVFFQEYIGGILAIFRKKEARLSCLFFRLNY